MGHIGANLLGIKGCKTCACPDKREIPVIVYATEGANMVVIKYSAYVL
jgi:hypothetical protein